LTPSTSSSTPPASKSAEDPFAPSAQDEEQESIRQTIPTGEQTADEIFGPSQEDPSPIPGAFPDIETPRGEVPSEPSTSTGLAVGAGAAAVATGAGVAAAANGNFDEYFGGPAHQRTPSEQVADFDSAFASMKKEVPTNGTSQGGVQEFPDIQEIDNEEESSDDDDVPMRFEDNFASPKKTVEPSPGVAETKENTKEPVDEAASAVPSYLQAPRPELKTTGSAASSLPGFEPQASPPTYQSTVPDENPTHFPREYQNLLPERDTTVSPPPASTSSPPATYGPEVGHAQNQDDQTSRQVEGSLPPIQSTPFDFDSAFAGVAPAQGDEDSDDEDDNPFKPSQTQAPEFDPTFDTPVQSRSTTAASQPIPTAQLNGSPQVSQNDQFFDFNKSQTETLAATTSGTAAGTAPISHDWEDIFSGLSSNKHNIKTESDGSGEKYNIKTGFGDDELASQSKAGPSDLNDPAPNALKQTTSIGPDVNAYTTAQSVEASKDPTPEPPPPQTPTQAQFSPPALTTTSPDTPVAAKTTEASPERPALGRAISTTSEHDDPILKRLTAMGWSRTDSLAALEKYDYNIDKVGFPPFLGFDERSRTKID
jgi:epidermal growth factor receptor substrate 15